MRAPLPVLLLLLGALCGGSGAQPTNSPRPGLLQLLDGSSLHGGLLGIDGTNGLEWAHPAAADPFQLRWTNLAQVRFDQAQRAPQSLKSTCRFHFVNGDEVIGNILSMRDEQLRIESWFAPEVRASLDSLDLIAFSSKGYNLLYEGPNGTEGWRIGRNPRSWEYRDGTFTANGADLLGRDFGLTGSSTLEFDLAWNGSFSLSITLYAQVIDRFDYSTSAYLVYLGTGAVSVQRVQAGSGAIMLGQAQIPEMLRRNKMKFEIRSNKEDATITLLADGKFISRWKDSAQGGFVAKGGGIVFFSQVEPGGLKLSNLRVAEWDGRFEPEALTNAPADMDVVFLANRDKVIGQVIALDDGKATVQTRQARLDIPFARITQVRFARASQSEPDFPPNQVKALFPGGESISFALDSFSSEKTAGHSRTFGPVSFDSKSIRQLHFNLPRTLASDEPASSQADFPELE